MPRIDVADDLGSWMSLKRTCQASSRSAMPSMQNPDCHYAYEIARMRIALANGCEVCRNARYAEGAKRTWTRTSTGMCCSGRPGLATAFERLAAQYAEGYATDHLALRENADFRRMRAHFSDEEIVDLALCCTLWLGAGRTMRVLDVGQAGSLTMSRKAA